MEAIFHLRTMVFVEEQGVDSALEFDEFEEVAKHWAALIEGKVVACARYRRTRLGFKIERMAVDAAVRQQGLGRALLLAVLEEVLPMAEREQCPVYLHAQVQALPFYTKLGFLPEGDEFEEADIAHYRCLYQGR
ncbi:MAG: GNAT family N-acetyltransferase [Cytophagia bacterium]|nr:GNAT family N-acetyltransferase [Cytophagia bacterium]